MAAGVFNYWLAGSHPARAADEPLPLILIGSGRTLRLRNVRVVNAASLAICLQLAPGQPAAAVLPTNCWACQPLAVLT
jgi:hypothetical protein